MLSNSASMVKECISIYRVVVGRSLMPDEIRIDNYHKEPHIHFKLKGMHIPVKYKDLEDVALIVELHLDRIRGIDKKTLVEELL